MEESVRIKTSPKEIFLLLTIIATLYLSTLGFINLLFEYIDYAFSPDKSYYYPHNLRGWLSSLIVAFPVFFFSTRALEKIYITTPVKRASRVRRWLLSLTIFLTGLAAMGDLVYVIYTFLSGELTMAAFLKTLSVLVVTAWIFTYYRMNLKDDQAPWQNKKVAAPIVLTVMAFVAMVLTGFWFSGSPYAEYYKRMDDRRVSDLMWMERYVLDYWQENKKLPESLAEIKAQEKRLKDPETKEPYEYRKTGANKFVVCATFKTENVGYYDRDWKHKAGKTCFEKNLTTPRR